MKNNPQNTALHPRQTPAIFGALASACIVYCIVLFIILQRTLTPGLAAIPASLQAASKIVLPALLAAGLFHIYLLAGFLKGISGRFLNSLFVLLVIGSGVLLCADVTLLSDIGKEYLLFDVTDQWTMLYVFAAFHLAIIVSGAFVLRRKKPAPPSRDGEMESIYIAAHHIALASGILGIAGIFFAMSGAVVPLRFAAGFMAVLAALALIPLIFILVYWRLRSIKKKGGFHIDEKQVSDTAFAGLAALLSALPVYILVCVLDFLSVFSLPVSFFILLLFFLQLVVFSSVVLAKNR